MAEETEDAEVFGVGRWIYCKSHMRPHTTGWCTVPASEKVALEADHLEAAYTETRKKGLPIYGEDK